MDDLWQKSLTELDKGNFTRLEALLGGPAGFDRHIVDWFENPRFQNEPEMLSEAFTCACMLGRIKTARYLLEIGVDPYKGIKTGLAGPHYAVSGGHLEIVNLLIEKNVPMNVKNMYGGTLLGQALWSAIYESKSSHAEIIEELINNGAEIEPGTFEWWNEQTVPSPETKERVSKALYKAKGV